MNEEAAFPNGMVIIDPRFRASYASYYISGLLDTFGSHRVRVDNDSAFRTLACTSCSESFEQYFAFLVRSDLGDLKVVVDYRDKASLSQPALEWSDRYGKVNCAAGGYPELDPANAKKIQAIGPGFGVRLWNRMQSFWSGLRSLTLSRFMKGRPRLREVYSGYNWQVKRPEIRQYEAASSDPSYVFHVSTLYLNQAQGDEANRHRAAFIRSARSSGVCFEGGLYLRDQSRCPAALRDVSSVRYFKAAEYLVNVKRSAVVFNTPAAWGCLGWKLGEYLALGKAIVSLPIQHRLPSPLMDNIHICFVRNESEIKDAVIAILGDASLRGHLEKNARKYWERYLRPESVIRRLVSANRAIGCDD